jgi:SAM-dependent methyltransferase
MSLVRLLHGPVFERRLEVLADHLSRTVDRGHRVLDLGCGDGRLGARLLELRPDLRLVGGDTLIRLSARIPAFQFDGVHLPLGDEAVDTVILVDVLHHTEDPALLLREASRVASTHVVVKDHLREGFLANPTLRFMDWVGNARYGVALPYNYLDRAQWARCLDEVGLAPEAWEKKLRLYPVPLSWAFDRSLHFVARLGKVGAREPR